MNCDECLERLDRYADRELTDAEVEEVRGHLERCPPCDECYRLQANLKRVVKVCCDKGRAPEGLRARLRQILF
jgi:mycothiol system anti-sigma-R factor